MQKLLILRQRVLKIMMWQHSVKKVSLKESVEVFTSFPIAIKQQKNSCYKNFFHRELFV